MSSNLEGTPTCVSLQLPLSFQINFYNDHSDQ